MWEVKYRALLRHDLHRVVTPLPPQFRLNLTATGAVKQPLALKKFLSCDLKTN